MSLSRSTKAAHLMFRGVFFTGLLASLMIIVPEAVLARGHGYHARKGARDDWNQPSGNMARQEYGQRQGRGLMQRARYRWNEASSAPDVPCSRYESCPTRNGMMLSTQN
jgi:hypothetical protein